MVFKGCVSSRETYKTDSSLKGEKLTDLNRTNQAIGCRLFKILVLNSCPLYLNCIG